MVERSHTGRQRKEVSFIPWKAAGERELRASLDRLLLTRTGRGPLWAPEFTSKARPLQVYREAASFSFGPQKGADQETKIFICACFLHLNLKFQVWFREFHTAQESTRVIINANIKC